MWGQVYQDTERCLATVQTPHYTTQATSQHGQITNFEISNSCEYLKRSSNVSARSDHKLRNFGFLGPEQQVSLDDEFRLPKIPIPWADLEDDICSPAFRSTEQRFSRGHNLSFTSQTSTDSQEHLHDIKLIRVKKVQVIQYPLQWRIRFTAIQCLTSKYCTKKKLVGNKCKSHFFRSMKTGTDNVFWTVTGYIWKDHLKHS